MGKVGVATFAECVVEAALGCWWRREAQDLYRAIELRVAEGAGRCSCRAFFAFWALVLPFGLF